VDVCVHVCACVCIQGPPFSCLKHTYSSMGGAGKGNTFRVGGCGCGCVCACVCLCMYTRASLFLPQAHVLQHFGAGKGNTFRVGGCGCGRGCGINLCSHVCAGVWSEYVHRGIFSEDTSTEATTNSFMRLWLSLLVKAM